MSNPLYHDSGKYDVRVDGERVTLDPGVYEHYAKTIRTSGTPGCAKREPREYGDQDYVCTREKGHEGSHVAHVRLGGDIIVLSMWPNVQRVKIKA